MRVTDAEGEMLGVMRTSEALMKSEAAGADLVEVSPKATPPVCKIIEYGKFLYALKKKEQQTRKANKTREQKGIRLTFKIDVGDLDRQRKQAEKFLEEGHPVRVQMRLRGRERAHTDLAVQKLNGFLESLSEVSKVDQPPKPSGFQIMALLRPAK
ncbi:MAG: translation initiation factor IF-3 [Candidatus Gracilibacteria bacterium]|nr:translation initiation factor IF-3 [Candidatus Gracilibacteria bacterium]